MKRETFGLTLIELIVSSALAALIGLFFAQTFRVISRFLAESEAKSSLKEAGDRITSQLNSDLASVVRVFGRRRVSGTDFTDDYTSFVDLTGCPAILPGSRLRAVGNGVGQSTGNILFIAKELPPLELMSGGVTIRIDRYVFIFYYVSVHANERPFGSTPSQHLYRWQSVIYVDSNQISNIDGGVRHDFITELKGKNVHFAYDPTQAFFDSAFFSLNPGGNMVPLVKPTIQCGGITQVTKNRGSRYLSDLSWGIDSSGFSVYASNTNPNRMEVGVNLIAQGAFPGYKYYETFSLCDVSNGQ